jgi:hypothetical protein
MTEEVCAPGTLSEPECQVIWVCGPFIVLKGDSYRLKGKGKEVMGTETTR